ncbi:MAG: NUDIX hydrolase, partial [Candidatus Dormibacteraeota bacterium]|nr:NUDIX hydrolase [Candidatus Dormibacteraeota bacterium]
VMAAGGLVTRAGKAGREEIAIVHRPAYDDWTLPKGKLDGAETLEQACLREVEEETGLRCELGEPVGSTEYRDRKGRPKFVFYWRLRPLGGRFRPTDEVDELRWLTVEEALPVLTYERDRALLRGAAPIRSGPGG